MRLESYSWKPFVSYAGLEKIHPTKNNIIGGFKLLAPDDGLDVVARMPPTGDDFYFSFPNTPIYSDKEKMTPLLGGAVKIKCPDGTELDLIGKFTETKFRPFGRARTLLKPDKILSDEEITAEVKRREARNGAPFSEEELKFAEKLVRLGQ